MSGQLVFSWGHVKETLLHLHRAGNEGGSSRWHSLLLQLHSFQWLPFYTHVTPL